MLLANPIYDAVFKVLMADEAAARGIISALIGMKVVELKAMPQEQHHKDPATGDILGMRLDFNAEVELADGRRLNVIIELQKIKIGSNALRFRQYLAQRYRAFTWDGEQKDNAVAAGVAEKDRQPVVLPIISVYLLGYELSADLPMATHVAREYRDAVTGEIILGSGSNAYVERPLFIEQLTHDAIFVQIPKIEGQMATELERVLSIFDQNQQLVDDPHRLEIEPKPEHTDPLIKRIYRILNQAQADPSLEEAMQLEDTFYLEQLDAIATERKLRRQVQAELEEEGRKRKEEARKRKEEARKRKEADRKRREAEAEVERLKKELGRGGPA